MFHYLLSDEFESQKNLDADLILFVRRFKLIGLANKSTIPENLLGGSSAQIPVKTIAKQMKKSRNRFRLKGGFDAKKRKKTLVDDPEIIFQVQNYFELDANSHIFQLSIEGGKIDKEQILMRFGPCLCKLGKTSCEKNENCSKFSLFSNLDKVPKSRAWQPRALKI